MSLLFPRRYDDDVPDLDGGQPMPRALAWALGLTLAAFYASNAFSSSITSMLITAKWLPLFALLAIAFGTRVSLREAPLPPMVPMVPLGLLLGASLISVWVSVDFQQSLMAMVVIVVTIASAYLTSSVVVATNSRKAFFDLIANFGRVIVAITAAMVILRINLGRGSGISAWTDNPNTLGAIIVPCMVLFFAGCITRERGWYYRHAPFLLAALVILAGTDSRASVFWIGISAAAYWIYRRGLAANTLVLVAILIVILPMWDSIMTATVDYLHLAAASRTREISPLSGRDEVWRIGWEYFRERPLLGYGVGTSQDLVKAEAWRFVRHQGNHFHSSYLATLVETGIFGCIAFLALLVGTLVRGLGDSDRTRFLSRSGWILSATPWALVMGAMAHALFESWLLNAGNVNMLLFWTWVWLIYHQSQIEVRPIVVPRQPRALAASAPLAGQ